MRTPQEAGVQTSCLASSWNRCISAVLVSDSSFLSDHLLLGDNWR